MADDPVTAIAKAVEESAKAIGKGFDAATSFGRFVERIVGPALDECGGALADKARFWRMSRLLRLQACYEAAGKELGNNRVQKAVEPKFAFALLEAASLENDDHLQDMFARLLANATTEGTHIEDRRAFVSILQEFKPLDARLLSMICRSPVDNAGLVYTAHLPHTIIEPWNTQLANATLPPRDVELALWNLVRLACIMPQAEGLGGGSNVAMVLPTRLGRALIEACTITPPRRPT